MRIEIWDINKDFIKCFDGKGFTCHCKDIREFDGDAVVSPANSRGYMDGGIDAIYMSWFGPQIQDNVRRACDNRTHGELLVGEAVVLETGIEKPQYLILAPTMRNLRKLPPKSTNPYLATRAAIHIASWGWKLDRVAIPGMGIGIGGLDYEFAAQQMMHAIRGEEFWEPF